MWHDATHGQFDRFSQERVGEMIEGRREFIVRRPASYLLRIGSKKEQCRNTGEEPVPWSGPRFKNNRSALSDRSGASWGDCSSQPTTWREHERNGRREQEGRGYADPGVAG